MKKEWIIQRGALGELPRILDELGSQRALLVTGGASYEHVQPQLEAQLPIPHVRYCDLSPNPLQEEVDIALSLLAEEELDVLIAIGGGSVMDFAKAWNLQSGRLLPLIAIPTTAGTGSECTPFSVLVREGDKMSIDDPRIIPDYALVDSALLASCPRFLRACAGADAYCQALESYWAVRADATSQAYAKEAIELAHRSLLPFVLGDDGVAADDMARASALSGAAIGISRTTAAHALSYAFTTRVGIPHGQAVALSMPDLFEAIAHVDDAHCNDARGVAYVQDCLQDILAMLGLSSTADFRRYWVDLMDAMQLETRLASLGIPDEERPRLAAAVDATRLQNTPSDLQRELPDFWKA